MHFAMIYFVYDPNFIKIGTTTQDVATRFKDFSACNARRLGTLGTMPGGRREELALHDAFREHRVATTEWFRPNKDLIAFASACGRIFGKNWIDEPTSNLPLPYPQDVNAHFLRRVIAYGRDGTSGDPTLDRFLEGLIAS